MHIWVPLKTCRSVHHRVLRPQKVTNVTIDTKKFRAVLLAHHRAYHRQWFAQHAVSTCRDRAVLLMAPKRTPTVYQTV